ncbi:hypothetical protein NE237_029437 [Protea cynaroides]|uniref:Uncharacterized protein n=1 Tax=Protea cynaroides TaxID=273540 RepID=A0A9Q0GSA8_9MAGN|nr:hypothetical protein NE237_029437 [Protea cynaroides]
MIEIARLERVTTCIELANSNFVITIGETGQHDQSGGSLVYYVHSFMIIDGFRNKRKIGNYVLGVSVDTFSSWVQIISTVRGWSGYEDGGAKNCGFMKELTGGSCSILPYFRLIFCCKLFLRRGGAVLCSKCQIS